MECIISALVKNEVGVLANIAEVFASEGLNIGSLSVGETENHSLSRITVVTEGEAACGRRIIEKLKDLPAVVKVIEFSHSKKIARELAFIKIGILPSSREDVIRIARSFQTKIISLSRTHVIMEVVEIEKGIDNLLELLRPYDIQEVVRSGQIAISL